MISFEERIYGKGDRLLEDMFKGDDVRTVERMASENRREGLQDRNDNDAGLGNLPPIQPPPPDDDVKPDDGQPDNPPPDDGKPPEPPEPPEVGGDDDQPDFKPPDVDLPEGEPPDIEPPQDDAQEGQDTVETEDLPTVEQPTVESVPEEEPTQTVNDIQGTDVERPQDNESPQARTLSTNPINIPTIEQDDESIPVIEPREANNVDRDYLNRRLLELRMMVIDAEKRMQKLITDMPSVSNPNDEMPVSVSTRRVGQPEYKFLYEATADAEWDSGDSVWKVTVKKVDEDDSLGTVVHTYRTFGESGGDIPILEGERAILVNTLDGKLVLVKLGADPLARGTKALFKVISLRAYLESDDTLVAETEAYNSSTMYLWPTWDWVRGAAP